MQFIGFIFCPDWIDLLCRGTSKKTLKCIGISACKTYYLNPHTKESQWEVPTGPPKKMSGQVQAAHLLVKHRESRRPASWRQDPITITKDEALRQLEEHIAKIKSGEKTFEELAEVYSDCSSAKRE